MGLPVVGMEERLCELKFPGEKCHAYAKDSARLGDSLEDDCEVICATDPEPEFLRLVVLNT